MTKIAFLGAGSTVFAKNLMVDILSFPELAGAEIALHDINPERLRTSEIVGRRVADQLGVSPTITATTERSAALDGADYAISMIQVGGYKPSTVIDFDIPAKYGLRQTIADTLGIGGIMRALRTVPVLVDFARDMERLCPDVVHLNYVNPMAMNCWALNRMTSIKTIGLCHSVQHTLEDICHDMGVPVDEVNFQVAGINHMAFYLRLEHEGRSLYPRLAEFAARDGHPWRPMGDSGTSMADAVRYEMFRRLGYFVTESSEHFSEYVPWFIKDQRPDLLTKFDIPLDEYPRRCVELIDRWESMRDEMENPTAPLEIKRSVEYGSGIIHSIETNTPRIVYGNVANNGLIDNLPSGCTVEVPCLVDRNGISPTKVGSLPPQLAGVIQTNVNVQSLTVEALVTGNREHIYHAAMLDPHTAAELDLDQIWHLVDDLIEAHADYLPESFRR